MNVLFLGPENRLTSWLRAFGEQVTTIEDRLTLDWVDNKKFDFLISYGYRHILKNDILSRFPDKAINLHISYLPWNRGADPNLWSFIDKTPKGVTLHYIDLGVDTGDIIAQKEIVFDKNETLSTSYQKLKFLVESLFEEQWPLIRQGLCNRQKQTNTGSMHKARDKEDYMKRLSLGWDTPISELDHIPGNSVPRL